VLDVEGQRTVAVELELVAVAQAEAVEPIRNPEAVMVINHDRPKGVRGRRLTLGEGEDVAVRAARRLTFTILVSRQLDHVLRTGPYQVAMVTLKLSPALTNVAMAKRVRPRVADRSRRMVPMRAFITLTIAGLLIAVSGLAAGVSLAQGYPDRPIRAIVPGDE
jgi:hypothetical protein